MSNNEGSPRSVGTSLKRVFGILKPKSTIHKLGQNPISVNPRFLIKQILDSSRQAIKEDVSEKELVTESGDSEN